MQKLKGKVALVAGATRGAGRGIATMLGEAGATVYCTGRSSRSVSRPSAETPRSPFNLASRPETIEETAEMVERFGGVGIPVRVDHTDIGQVKALVERIRGEQGRLDILVNDIWGGEEFTAWGKPFWEASLDDGLRMQAIAIHTHIITSHTVAPVMVAQGTGLIVEITDGDTADYRGNFFYDLVKTSVIRLAFGMAQDLRPHGVTAVALTPGFLRSEAMLEHFGVSEANWREGAKVEPHFIASETPYYVGRAVAALAADPDIFAKTSRALSTWGLSEEYDFVDVDGRRPHWGRYLATHVQGQAQGG